MTQWIWSNLPLKKIKRGELACFEWQNFKSGCFEWCEMLIHVDHNVNIFLMAIWPHYLLTYGSSQTIYKSFVNSYVDLGNRLSRLVFYLYTLLQVEPCLWMLRFPWGYWTDLWMPHRVYSCAWMVSRGGMRWMWTWVIIRKETQFLMIYWFMFCLCIKNKYIYIYASPPPPKTYLLSGHMHWKYQV